MPIVQASLTTTFDPVIATNFTSSLFEATVPADNGSKPQWPEVTANIQTASGQDGGLHWSTVARAICYIILFVIGIIGNLLVLFVTVWRRNRKQVGDRRVPALILANSI
jgi:hypothetical protein